jgi:hypothetical protein
MGFNALLNQTGTLYSQTTKNLFGRPAQTNAQTVKCRFEQVKKTIVNLQGETEPIDGIVFIDTDITPTVGDQFVFDSQKYRVMKVQPMVDGRGKTRHIEFMVQSWITS